jgi:hypothetical protein
MTSNNTTDTATTSNSADTPNYSASHQKAQPLPLGELYKDTRLTVTHWDYLVKKRDLPRDFVEDNCESMTAKTAKGYLGYNPPSEVQSFTDWLIKVDQEFKDNGINADDLPQKIGKLGAQRAQLKLVVNNRLRYNEFTKEIELDGISIGSDDFKLELDETFGLELKCTEKDLKAIVIKTLLLRV